MRGGDPKGPDKSVSRNFQIRVFEATLSGALNFDHCVVTHGEKISGTERNNIEEYRAVARGESRGDGGTQGACVSAMLQSPRVLGLQYAL